MFPYPISFLSSTDEAFSSTKSLDFDGVDDYVNCGNVTALNGLSHGSWSFWLNSSVTSTNGIFNQWGTGTDRLIYSWILMSSGRMDIYFDGSAKYRVTGNSIINALNTGEWFNLVIVFDGTLPNNSDQTGRLKVYINGDLLSDGFSFVTGPTAMPSTTSDLVLGHAFTYGSFWDGYMDEVGIWNSSLTQAAVTEIYNAGTPNDLNDLTNATNPSVWYRMGENATFKEPQILMPENSNKDKVSNFSMEFDGMNDRIDCGANSSLQPTSGITLSTWFMIPTADLHFGADTLISQDHIPWGGLYNGYYMEATIAANGYLYSQFSLGNGTSETSVTGNTNSVGAPPYVGDTWYNLVGTWDGSDMTLYINGELLGTTAFSGPITYDASQETWIGNRGHGQSDYFVGSIDEVSMFNSVKAIGDIWDGTGKPTDLTGQSGLVGYWKMGEEATFDATPTEWTIPNLIGGNNGVSANMDIYTRVGDAPDSPNNALSYNMDAAAIVEDTPPNT